MKAICERCGESAEFLLKKVTVKAGDNGYRITEAWECQNCHHVPLLRPKFKVGRQ